jgi:hypothetical protein
MDQESSVRLVMVEKEIDEIGQVGRPRRQTGNGLKLKEIENGIGNVGRGRGRWTTGSPNVEANG